MSQALKVVRLDIEQFCRQAALPRACVIEIVEHGILEPSGRTPADWRFDDQAQAVARKAAKLHQELELEWEGVALALELLEELRELRRENVMLKQRLGRFLLD